VDAVGVQLQLVLRNSGVVQGPVIQVEAVLIIQHRLYTFQQTF
jgi:hypothetical protein